MTLAELRTQLRTYVYDTSGDFFTDAICLTLLNTSMRHVANLVSAVQPHLLLAEYTGTISNGSSLEYVLISMSGQTYPSVRRLVRASRTGGTGEATLEITTFDRIEHEKTGAMSSRPKIFLYNEQFGFVEPTNGTAVSVHYLHGLSPLVLDADSPGVSNGTGTANKLPVEWQDLIPLKAAILGLSADRRDTTALMAEYQSIRGAILDGVNARRRTPENG